MFIVLLKNPALKASVCHDMICNILDAQSQNYACIFQITHNLSKISSLCVVCIVCECVWIAYLNVLHLKARIPIP